MTLVEASDHGWDKRRDLYGPSGSARPRRREWHRQPRDTERGARIAAAVLAEQQAPSVSAPRLPFDDLAAARIIAAAVARISPAETAAALGWTLGELLAAEVRLGVHVTVTIEVRP
ncbi:hypothetical protein [Rhodoplanes serenus]|uniref:hypothetical protein n=1 Tax=Rhodoplanes serenus TaxID=200615 RepID=UPI000DADAA77|nr:hypothetical protein [Rhodoplanes serenus]RAI33729.1 hypothetical protein CH340_11305 [Rhodoplanes serenus]